MSNRQSPAAEDFGYPRELRLKGPSLWFTAGMFVALSLASLAGVGWYWIFSHEPDRVRNVFLAFCALGLMAGPLATAYSLRERTRVYRDWVEHRGLFVAMRLNRPEILGYRLHAEGTSAESITLIPRDEHRPSLKLPTRWLAQDPAALAWLDGLRDLDLEDHTQAEHALLAHHALGSTAQERRRTLANWKRITRVLSFIGWGVGVWGFLWPTPYLLWLALAAAAPLVAVLIVLVARGAVGFSDARLDPRASVAELFMLPMLVLGARALIDYDLLDSTELAVAGAAVGVVATAIAFGCGGFDRKPRKPVFRLLGYGAVFLLCWDYGFGLVTEADVQFDRSRPHVYPTTVQDMQISSGKHRSYELKLAPWGPRTDPQEVEVGHRFYDSVAKGQTVCVYLYSGALGWRWFEVHSCN